MTTFWMGGTATLTPAGSGEVFWDTCGATGTEPMVRLGTATGFSFWYRQTSGATHPEFRFYDSGFGLINNTPGFPIVGTWQRWNAVPGSWPMHVSVANAGGSSTDIRWSQYTEPYDISTDPANPSYTPPTPSPCVPRVKASMPAVAVLDQAILSGALALIPSSWWGFLLEWYVGSTIDTSVLCAAPPPTITTIATDFLINPGHGAFDVLSATLWPYYCECTPATPPAVVPPLPSPTQPPGWPAAPTYPVNPTNPCLDLTEVRHKLDELMRLVQRDLELDKLVQRYHVPFAYIKGAVHSGLTGAASLNVPRIIGIQVDITSRPAGLELEGTPPYLWDMGWLSVMTGDGMIQEVRLTRDPQIWQPQLAPEATVVGYFLKPGVVASITELYAEP